MAKKREIDQEMAKRLKRLLEEKHINAAALGRQTGIRHYTQMKKGTRPINAKALKAVAQDTDLGPKAVAWILIGAYEEELFPIAKTKEARAYGEAAGGTKGPSLVPEHGGNYKKTPKCPFGDLEVRLEACRALSELQILDNDMFLDVVDYLKNLASKLQQFKKNT